MKIPFNKTYLTGRETHHIQELLSHGEFTSGGPYSDRCVDLLQTITRSEHPPLLTPSCTAALEMAALLLNIKSGDEVIMPSFTFTSTANAFLLRGANIQFADIESSTYNVSATTIEPLITDRTRAIIVIHYAGVSCDMDPILELAKKHNIPVVEDAAQCIGASYKNKPLGTLGDFATYSFHETKNVSCGEGGALFINNPKHLKRAKIIQQKGTNREDFFNKLVSMYEWVDVGSSYVLSELSAAFLLGQLEQLDTILALRKKAFTQYQDALQPMASRYEMLLPKVPDYAQPNWHTYSIVLASDKVQAGLMNYLQKEGILAVRHYAPLHSSALGRSISHSRPLPTTENIAQRLLRLPLYSGITQIEVDYVVSHITSYFKKTI